tara:strand:- start:95 stop:367 length:273 start_codon:yes stop_codon:yes gene_type:complete
MVDPRLPEGTEVVDLPNVVTLGYAVHTVRATGTEGEQHVLVALSLEFQASPGKVGRQTFLMQKDVAKHLRSAMKNPKEIHPESEEDQHNE